MSNVTPEELESAAAKLREWWRRPWDAPEDWARVRIEIGNTADLLLRAAEAVTSRAPKPTGLSLGAALGQIIASYRDSEPKRCAEALVEIIHQVQFLQNERDGLVEKLDKLMRDRKEASPDAEKRQRDFENVPTSVDYDNDCAPD